MHKKQKVVYYRDELNDEFSDGHIDAKKIDGNYCYIRDDSPIGKVLHIFWYRIIATPLAWLYMKLHFRHKIVNRQVLKKADGAYYIYGNHTHFLADALVPTMVNFPKDVSVIVHPDNVSMPLLGRITPTLGGLPLPDDKEAMKHFIEALEKRVAQKRCVMIYPEAHIWPFYTGIRPFKDTSFRYPVQQKLPVFSLTNTYQKRRYSKKPKMVTYIDGPFYADASLPVRQQKKMLRNQVYETMKKRAKNNTVVCVRYEKMTGDLGETL